MNCPCPLGAWYRECCSNGQMAPVTVSAFLPPAPRKTSASSCPPLRTAHLGAQSVSRTSRWVQQTRQTPLVRRTLAPSPRAYPWEGAVPAHWIACPTRSRLVNLDFRSHGATTYSAETPPRSPLTLQCTLFPNEP